MTQKICQHHECHYLQEVSTVSLLPPSISGSSSVPHPSQHSPCHIPRRPCIFLSFPFLFLLKAHLPSFTHQYQHLPLPSLVGRDGAQDTTHSTSNRIGTRLTWADKHTRCRRDRRRLFSLLVPSSCPWCLTPTPQQREHFKSPISIHCPYTLSCFLPPNLYFFTRKAIFEESVSRHPQAVRQG